LGHDLWFPNQKRGKIGGGGGGAKGGNHAILKKKTDGKMGGPHHSKAPQLSNGQSKNRNTGGVGGLPKWLGGS